MRISFFLLLPILAFILPASGISQDCKLVKRKKNGVVEEAYAYTEDGKLDKITVYNEAGEQEGTIEAIYDENGNRQEMRWTDTEDNVTRRMIMKYDEQGHVTRRDVYEPDDAGNMQTVRFVTYDIDPSQPFPIKRIIYYNSEGKIDSYKILNYTDDMGSTIAVSYTKGGQALSSETWKRDDKKNPDQLITPFPYQEEHNVISRVIVGADGTIQEGSFSAEVNYNEMGYPTQTMVSKMLDEEAATYIYEYDCK